MVVPSEFSRAMIETFGSLTTSFFRETICSSNGAAFQPYIWLSGTIAPC